MVKARAIVDQMSEVPDKKGSYCFRVEVWGEEPHDFTRLYEVWEKSDNLAAQECLRRFCEEMERKFPEGD